MAVPQSNVGICNLALTMLSAERIESLTEDTENARKCNASFVLIRDSLLDGHNWNFALNEASLALLDDSPVTEDWAYMYQLPSDCLRVVHHEGNYGYKIFGRTLYSNDSTCKIQYIKRETDPTKYSSQFTTAFAARLAATLAYGITKNATQAKNMEELAQGALKEAKWADAQEGMGNTVVDGYLTRERQK